MAHKLFGNISLCWRPKSGERRHIVGVIHQSASGITFKYNDAARKLENFTPLASFPDLNQEYNINVLENFSQRLTRAERPDIQRYYDFWKIEPEYRDDKLYILAKTQGLQAGDMFEFLADYNPIKGMNFVSEICGLSHAQLPSDTLKIGDQLKWKAEPDNMHDKNAIALYKENIKLGYVKLVHNRVFAKHRGNIQIEVMSIETNGHLNKAYIRIYL
jgi:hypothetical protein